MAPPLPGLPSPEPAITAAPPKPAIPAANGSEKPVPAPAKAETKDDDAEWWQE